MFTTFNFLNVGQYFMLLLSSADFFQNKYKSKIIPGALSGCQTVCIAIRTEILSSLECQLSAGWH